MPLSMNAFAEDAFSMMSLTAAVNQMDYVPGLLGSLNIFTPKPVFTQTVAVERRGNTLRIIPQSPMGAAPKEEPRNPANIRDFRCTRLADSFTLYAHEVQGMRAFGTESEFEVLQTEYAQRMSEVRANMDLTHEHHRLGALNGKLLDADGTTVIYDYFAEFGVTKPTAINFALDTATTDVRGKCTEVVRAVSRGAKGNFTQTSQVHALCGDEFFDKLVSHDRVRDTYLNHTAAAALREPTAFESFYFGGITFHNYRGTDDGSTVAVPTAEARFFPVGARDVFQQAMAPAEFGPFVNTRGQDSYALNIVDKDRQAWSKGELYSYPLYICSQPEALQSGLAA